MTVARPLPAGIAPTTRSEKVDARLWDSLGHPVRRDPPPKGADVFGERIRGTIARAVRGRRLRERAEEVLRRATDLAKIGEREFSTRVEEVASRVAIAHDMPETLTEAYAAVYEAVRRIEGISLHPEQVMGGIAMAGGCAAEMATGEGKTLTAIMPVAFHAWLGRGVHVVTVNDYLAKRDAEITGPVLRRLGLSVGSIQDGSTAQERAEAYRRDVTYAADKQVIFDFLRDRLRSPAAPRLVDHLLDVVDGPGREGDWSGQVVQRGLFACVVDEADSVLIDEAVTPAIISADSANIRAPRAELYATAARIAASLREGTHYTIDRKLRRVRLTQAGAEALATEAESLPVFWRGPRRREELVTQAITARELFKRDDEYVVIDGEVQIVDPSTGRVLPGRQWQLGLHQAVEAKEGLDVTEPRSTSSRVSYQRFFQRYKRLCGMSGTLAEVRHELWSAYGLPVVRIPTHRPVARRRLPDRFFRTEGEKFEAVADRVVALRDEGRPVLVGTRSVSSSERLAAMLAARGVDCRVLNATKEAEEAAIVAGAGRARTVTVATNMAGRGTDIKLDPEARRAGGLAVIATERHDEARIDRQLFGRAGRQGDPGLAQAFVSLEDALIQRHGLRWLAGAARQAPPGVAGLVARVLWRQAQSLAQWQSSMVRAEIAKADAWLDVSLHAQSR